MDLLALVRTLRTSSSQHTSLRVRAATLNYNLARWAHRLGGKLFHWPGAMIQVRAWTMRY